METPVDSLIIVAMLILAAAALIGHSRRSRTLLDRWAARNEYRIIEADYRNFFRGPFFWTTSRGQAVYRVRVEGVAGIVQSGWVRCGSRSFGVLSDKVDVRWDEASAEVRNRMHDR